MHFKQFILKHVVYLRIKIRIWSLHWMMRNISYINVLTAFFIIQCKLKTWISILIFTFYIIFLWLSLGRNQYRREGLWFVCLLYDGSTRRLTESGFMWFYGFYGEAGNRTCDRWFTRHSTYPLHHGGLEFWISQGTKLVNITSWRYVDDVTQL